MWCWMMVLLLFVVFFWIVLLLLIMLVVVLVGVVCFLVMVWLVNFFFVLLRFIRLFMLLKFFLLLLSKFMKIVKFFGNGIVFYLNYNKNLNIICLIVVFIFFKWWWVYCGCWFIKKENWVINSIVRGIIFLICLLIWLLGFVSLIKEWWSRCWRVCKNIIWLLFLREKKKI